jgi:hypothetical protein
VTQPLDGVCTVGFLVDHRFEGALGAECATHALEDDVITARGVDAGVQRGERKAPTVRAADQQRACRGVGRRLIVVGEQPDAVAHRYPHAPMHGVFGRLRR